MRLVVVLVLSLSAGLYVGLGHDAPGTYSNLSDRNQKENFNAVDAQELLSFLSEIPVTTWNYVSQSDSIRHMGPMAQDFFAAFGLGEDDKHIGTVDADGVVLAAIQGLLERIERLEIANDRLKEQLASTEKRLDMLVGTAMGPSSHSDADH